MVAVHAQGWRKAASSTCCALHHASLFNSREAARHCRRAARARTRRLVLVWGAPRLVLVWAARPGVWSSKITCPARLTWHARLYARAPHLLLRDIMQYMAICCCVISCTTWPCGGRRAVGGGLGCPKNPFEPTPQPPRPIPRPGCRPRTVATVTVPPPGIAPATSCGVAAR